MLKKIYNWSNSWTGTIVIVLSVIFFVAQAFVIPSGSMKNTLLIGDMLFVKKFAYGIPTPTIPWIELKVLPDFNNNGHLIEGDRPKRGDIVVFRYPNNPDVHYVKRCVATSGDMIALQNKHLLLRPKFGDPYIKKYYSEYKTIMFRGELWVQDPYRKEHSGIHNDQSVTPQNSTHSQLFDFEPVIVQEDHFFMMGDNRDHSYDSRFWGTVPYKFIVGTPWFLYFSIDENKVIRWDRMFKTIKTIDNDTKTTNKIIHKNGIY